MSKDPTTRVFDEEAILQANREEAERLDYQKQLQDWDITLSDSLTYKTS